MGQPVTSAPSRVMRREPPARVVEPARGVPDRERVFSLVYRQMHALHGRWHPDFDDLVQSAAEQALRSLPAFRGAADLSTWTYRICYHVVLRHRRSFTRWLKRFTLDRPDADAPLPAPGADSELERHERFQRLASALDRLSAKRRAVVMLRDIEGLGIEEIAAIVGAGEATVRSRLRDARRDLAKLLEADPYFGAAAVEDEP
jgi:RNA polymerase sigma-70 factor (ECF subfamily)